MRLVPCPVPYHSGPPVAARGWSGTGIHFVWSTYAPKDRAEHHKRSPSPCGPAQAARVTSSKCDLLARTQRMPPHNYPRMMLVPARNTRGDLSEGHRACVSRRRPLSQCDFKLVRDVASHGHHILAAPDPGARAQRGLALATQPQSTAKGAEKALLTPCLRFPFLQLSKCRSWDSSSSRPRSSSARA